MSSPIIVALRAISAMTLCTCIVACDDPKPQNANPNGLGGSGGSNAVAEVACDANKDIADLTSPSCTPLADDYTPRDNASANDSWPACISDGNAFVPFGPNVPSSAHVDAFLKIGELLGFGGLKAPTPQEFQNAYDIYTQEMGIDSFLPYLEDDHYPKAPKSCSDMTPQEQANYPSRCVGSIRIRPILNIAFDTGIRGEQPILNVARIESALLWYFHASIFAAATNASNNVFDVDAMRAYYTGTESRENPVGLAKYVQLRSQDAHDRIWDGLLAVRCWRDLDNPAGISMDSLMHQNARTQLDRALLRGMALIVRQRAEQLSICEPAWESVEILGGILIREAEARNAEQSAIYIEEISRRNADLVDKNRLITSIDALFPCP